MFRRRDNNLPETISMAMEKDEVNVDMYCKEMTEETMVEIYVLLNIIKMYSDLNHRSSLQLNKRRSKYVVMI